MTEYSVKEFTVLLALIEPGARNKYKDLLQEIFNPLFDRIAKHNTPPEILRNESLLTRLNTVKANKNAYFTAEEFITVADALGLTGAKRESFFEKAAVITQYQLLVGKQFTGTIEAWYGNFSGKLGKDDPQRAEVIDTIAKELADFVKTGVSLSRAPNLA